MATISRAATATTAGYSGVIARFVVGATRGGLGSGCLSSFCLCSSASSGCAHGHPGTGIHAAPIIMFTTARSAARRAALTTFVDAVRAS
jgi:hypothetical protein